MPKGEDFIFFFSKVIKDNYADVKTNTLASVKLKRKWMEREKFKLRGGAGGGLESEK